MSSAISYLFLLISALQLADLATATASICPNRYYCHANEIKYRSFKAMPGFYFNTSKVIQSLSIEEEKMCLRECTKTEQCQSMNHYRKSGSIQMTCDLIDGNIYSNSTQLEASQNSTHYYIQSPCSSNPCKNAGTCIPLYQTASYRCACTLNNNTIWKFGPHCETLTVSEMTAKLYYNFDGQTPLTDKVGTKSVVLSKSGSVKTMYVPDHLTSVVYFGPGLQLRRSISSGDCMTYPEGCSNGVTLSFWIKLRKMYQDLFTVSSKCVEKFARLLESPNMGNSYQGTNIRLRGCTSDAWYIRFRTAYQLYALSWGSLHDKAWLKWTHVVITFKVGVGITLYVNGTQKSNQASYTSMSLGSRTSNFGLNTGNAGIGYFLDDFAKWDTIFNAKDVETVYNDGLKRNDPNFSKA